MRAGAIAGALAGAFAGAHPKWSGTASLFTQLLALLLLTACGPTPPDEPTGITRACVRSFPPTLDAWEVVFGDVKAECRKLDTVYAVQVVAERDMPCDEPVGTNQVRTECLAGGVLYINDALDELQQVDASVHGWLHALSLCVFGDVDEHHLMRSVWRVYGEETIEYEAHFYGVEPGSCL